MPGPDDSEGLVTFRLTKMEKEIQDLMLRSEGWHNSLAAGITALSNQVGAFSASLPEFYAPRREADERHRAINERFESLEKRIDDRRAVIDQRVADLSKELDQRFTDNVKANTTRIERIEQRMWAIAIGVLGAIGMALFDFLKPK